jgi:S-adenosylmethionine:tRNA ribosyltransferase-isomerase
MTLAPIRRVDSLDGFVVPAELEARGPAESRGLERDGVRLMVSDGHGQRHLRFDQLHSVLGPGDLLVVNDSATIPASVRSGDVVVNFSTPLPGGLRVVELRRPAGPSSLPWKGNHPRLVRLPGDAEVELLAPFPVDSRTRRLWVATFEADSGLAAYLAKWGGPIRYGHVDAAHPLGDYQTVFGEVPGSAEMPSAGRPFTDRLLTRVMVAGIAVAPVTLHTGVSSLEAGEEPYPEWFQVPASTAGLVDHTRHRGGRVVAVGTTVARALETSADDHGGSHPGKGWTDLVVSPDRAMRVVDGLITGWHEPTSSHLHILQALAGREALVEAYREALAEGYLWHEFGDSHLILPSGQPMQPEGNLVSGRPHPGIT